MSETRDIEVMKEKKCSDNCNHDGITIPLEEYKEFLAFQIKGPTVEISLSEYNALREEKENLREQLHRTELENGRLGALVAEKDSELQNRKNIDTMLRAFTTDIKGFVSDSVTNISKEQRTTQISEAPEFEMGPVSKSEFRPKKIDKEVR